jgi:hypothetical protein
MKTDQQDFWQDLSIGLLAFTAVFIVLRCFAS